MNFIRCCCFLSAVVLLLVSGCGGGGGGSGSSAALAGGTIYGRVVAPAALSQRLNKIVAQTTQSGNGVSKALVWLEEKPGSVTLTDDDGNFVLSGVDAGVAQRVVCRYDIAASGELFLARSEPVLVNTTNPFLQLGELTLEQGLYSVSGCLRNQFGSVVANAQLSLWGIKFKSDLQGYFVSPPLPESASKEMVTIEASGYRTFAIELPFLHSTNNNLSVDITLSDQSEPNIAPIVFFAAVPAQIAPSERVQLQILVIDPDELDTNHFEPVWNSIAGKIDVTADPFIVWWTAPDAPGLATVSVSVEDSRGAFGAANIGIAVGGNKNPVMRIASVLPAAGAPGARVVISGSGFGAAQAGGQVSFNGVSATVQSWSDQQIVTEVPVGATTGILLISGVNGEKSAGVFNILDAGLAIDPQYGPPGTVVALSGKDFGADSASGGVLVNGTSALIQSWSDNLIRFVVPEGATGGVVTLNLRGREKSAGMFRVTRVFGVSSQKATLGTLLTISGEGWGLEQAAGAFEFFSGVSAPVVSWSDTKVVIRVPSGAQTGDLKASIQGVSFVVTSLTINSIAQAVPDRGIAGDEIVVSGTGFGASLGSSYVTIGETRAEIIAWSDNLIRLRIAPDTRPGNLVVHAGGIDSNGVSVVVTAITSISCVRRPVGSSITINGYGFGQDTGFVLFGDTVSRDFAVWQDDTIQVVIPDSATGTAPVAVSNMGVRSLPVSFFVTWFDSVDQTEGWPGREVVISGNNFGSAAPGDMVTFNGVEAPVISWSNSEIHVRVPAKTVSGPMVLTISGWPIVVEEDFTVVNSFEYAPILPDWSGPRANSRPLLPGLAKDDDGNLFISDFDNGWIWKIAEDGTQSKFGNLTNPWGVAISPVSNNLYVADSGNHCVRIFDLDGNLLDTIGAAGNADGEFASPRGLAFDKNGRLYVADSGNSRVQIFETTPAIVFLATLGTPGSGNGQFVSPSGVVIDDSLTLYVADAGNHRIQRFFPDNAISPTNWSFAGWIGSKDPNFDTPGWQIAGSGLASARDGGFRNPYGVGLSDDGTLLVADTNNNRIQLIDATSGQFAAQIGAAGTTSGQYNQPLAVISAEEKVCIADSSNSRIQMSTLAGAYIAQIIPDTSLLNTNPRRIAVDSVRCRVYVLDTDDGSITVLGIDGNVIQVLGSRGAGATQLYRPEGIALDSAGNLFVADTGNARIQMISAEGNFVQSWGAYGTGAGQFFSPKALAVSEDGEYVFVADSALHRIQKFTKNGAFITDWGSLGDSDDNFNTPSGITIDRFGTIYVADTQNHRIKKYSSDGMLIGWWGSYDAGAQSFWLDPDSQRTGAVSDADGGFDTPTDVSVDHEGNVFVADSGNFRIQRFSADQTVGAAAGYQTEIYVGENLFALAIDNWATVYTLSDGKVIKRFVPDL